MYSFTYRLFGLFSFLAICSLAQAQDTSSSANAGPCEGSPELNVISNNINLDQKTMTFYLEGDIYVTGNGFCFATDSEVSIVTNEQNPSKIDEFEITGAFSLTLAREKQTNITANKGKFHEEENKFDLEGNVVVINFLLGEDEVLNADNGEYFVSTDDFTLSDNVNLKIETISVESNQAEFNSADNVVKFSNQVIVINNDPDLPSEIKAETAEYNFDERTIILSSNVSGNYGPSFFSGRDRLVYNLNSEDN